MMIGEFEFGDVFLSLENVNDKTTLSAFPHRIFYDATTYIIFILFLIIMSIILMNLLVSMKTVTGMDIAMVLLKDVMVTGHEGEWMVCICVRLCK